MERWRSTHVINNFDLVTLAKLPPLVEPFRRRRPYLRVYSVTAWGSVLDWLNVALLMMMHSLI